MHSINKRYKLFKAAVTTKCPVSWQKYKKGPTEVTAALGKAKASCFKKMFEEVKESSTYWNLISKHTIRTERNSTSGPLRSNDGSLALIDKGQLMNSYFATIGEDLISTLPTITDNSQTQNTKQDELPALSTTITTSITVTNRAVEEKINKLKTNKSSGPTAFHQNF